MKFIRLKLDLTLEDLDAIATALGRLPATPRNEILRDRFIRPAREARSAQRMRAKFD
jgi:hypothetical protein